jgi:hypothetical protein
LLLAAVVSQSSDKTRICIYAHYTTLNPNFEGSI